VAVVEREPRLATHQTGRNSNVIHSGLYYAPGGLKARLAVAGCAETVAFCREHDLPHQVCGKLVVATEPDELPRMKELARRGDANGVENHELDQAGMRAHEPHVRGIAALWVPSTGICDYRAVAEKLGELLVKEGGEIHLGRSVTSLVRRRADVVVRGDGPELLGTQVVACAGLHCDELARASGADPGVRIVPFRGEYAGFSERAAALVRGLIYPVPDPAFPFLGVHATRGIDGHVHAGPNAVLALAREGYGWGTVNPRELLSTLAYPGMLRIAKQHWRYGFGEMHRSLSKAAMARQIQRMLPDVQASDLSPAGAGCARAGRQARRHAGGRLPVRRAGSRPRRGAARPQRALARRHRRPADRPRDPGEAGMSFRSGFACFVGRPNAGKSTLTNALIGSKVAITSSRPQTTRHAIRGILHRPDAQLIVIDTPGLHKPRTLLGARLNDVVRETWSEVDVIGFCVPAGCAGRPRATRSSSTS
jgi:L-2-hydroxyglutarate oxidase